MLAEQVRKAGSSRLRGCSRSRSGTAPGAPFSLCRDRKRIQSPCTTRKRGAGSTFSSDPRYPAAIGDTPPRLRPRSMLNRRSPVPNPRTICKGIRKLAHFLTVRNGTVTMRKYWELAYSEGNGSTVRELTEEFQDLWRECIDAPGERARLRGALSGGDRFGDDSRLRAEVSSTRLEDHIHKLRQLSSVEADAAQGNGRCFPERTTFPSLSARTAWTITRRPSTIWRNPWREPVPSPNATYRAAAKGPQGRALTGEGSDELLAGYHWYPGEVWSRLSSGTVSSSCAPSWPRVFSRSSRGAGAMGTYRVLRRAQ